MCGENGNIGLAMMGICACGGRGEWGYWVWEDGERGLGG